MAAVNALAGGASGFTDSRPCWVLTGTGHELAVTTRHPGCYHGASKTIRGDVRGPATFSTALAGGEADFSATMPAPRKRSAKRRRGPA